MDEIVVFVKNQPHGIRFREQTRSVYIATSAAVLNGEGFILTSKDVGEMVFGPGMVTHIRTYMTVNWRD